MRNSRLTSVSINHDWQTARVADPGLVRRCLGRLDADGFEYQVVLDNRQLRILVRQPDLEEVLDLLSDLSTESYRPPVADKIDSNQSVRLLFAIPLGAAIGSISSALLGSSVHNGVTVSAICAGVAALLAVLSSNLSDKPSHHLRR